MQYKTCSENATDRFNHAQVKLEFEITFEML